MIKEKSNKYMKAREKGYLHESILIEDIEEIEKNYNMENRFIDPILWKALDRVINEEV